MLELLVPLAIFVFLAFPIWTLVLLLRLRHDQLQQGDLLDRLLHRMDRLAAADKKPAPLPPSAPAPAPLPVPTPPPPPRPAPLPPPPPVRPPQPVRAPPPAPAFARGEGLPPELVARPCGHLFGRSVTRIALKRGAWLRHFVYRLAELVSDRLTRELIERAMSGQAEDYGL